MTEESATKFVSTGICSFCKDEFPKARMTQHLKRCKERAAEVAAETEDTDEQKTRLFHLLVEGRYNPQYWMHLEIPASEPLETLDYFLRDIWLECCGHLSAFKIGDTEYSSEPEDFYFGEAPMQEEEEEESEEDESDGEADIDELLSTFPPEFVKIIPPDLIAELKNAESSDEIVTFLKEQLKSLPKGGFPHTPEEMDEYRTRYFQRTLMESLLDMLEDRSLEVPLEKVLKVGQKFSHEYDFGSTTHLNLRVISEREGIIGDEEDPVEILAQNVPPPILCKVCGKPATKVASGYYDAEENGYCDKCARKSRDADMMLPVVNSPRVGVCGYTG